MSAILFYPRGGSAHAARAIAQGLRDHGCQVTLVAGSRSGLGGHADARTFYGEVQAVDYDPALATNEPTRFEGPPGTAPMHPSFEDRPGAPDKVFAMLDDLDYERQVRSWSRELTRAGAPDADVLHLHHLTPLNEAAARIAPGVPVVGQLHGTELLMLEQILTGAPATWRHAERWAQRMRGWAQRCARLVVPPAGVERALRLLEVPRERVLALPNGVDVKLFTGRDVDRSEFWQEVLIADPQGAMPDEPLGSARYDEADVARLAAGTCLLYVGRFTAVKRLDLLIEAFGDAHQRLKQPAGLVLVGGHPGEWEGEHPGRIVERLSVPDVFFAGWHAHEQLPRFFSAADAVLLSSDREQFGQVLVEGMACGLPVVATRSLGPASIVEDGRTGWLVPRQDAGALATAITEVVSDPAERRRRGEAARLAARERYSWSGISAKLAVVLEEAAGGVRPAIGV